MHTEIAAATAMDWQQVVGNGGPPCFHLEESGHFCGRAQRWHDEHTHPFRPMERMLRDFHQAARELIDATDDYDTCAAARENELQNGKVTTKTRDYLRSAKARLAKARHFFR